ncbi:hypothetical protein AJ79_06236 [Helicocarpus griseus UAMH5409]|uniref:Guanylate kinase-like domain-containing protein n=1 Tax=Helicocarpus griseus UAMH5409 TaxID=1447875 RepID=A0A2B7XEJ4_9EURO|nr:hypothetical protein AJ79_06236 [Helicocarpus griseus UAMH5409]
MSARKWRSYIALLPQCHPAHPRRTSHTTRKPRSHEVEGNTPLYSGDYYGTSKQTIADKFVNGLVAILDIDINGVKQLKANSAIDARYVFIKPPSFETLEARLRSRCSDDEDAIRKRLDRARAELAYADEPGFADKVIDNSDLEVAFAELEEFVYMPVAQSNGVG